MFIEYYIYNTLSSPQQQNKKMIYSLRLYSPSLHAMFIIVWWMIA